MRKRQEEKAKESAKALRNVLSKIKLSKYNLEIIKNKDGVISFIETLKYNQRIRNINKNEN